MRGYGLTGSAAVHGFAVLQAGGGFGYPEDFAESFDLLVELVLVRLREVYA